jgi:glycosyltransferase involved in cell wall biosynthesis
MSEPEDKGPELVSLVMPVWQPHAAWLQQAVRSCLAQTHSNLELIVLDDGCAEPIASLLHDFDDPRLRVLRTSHGGVSSARNAGLAAARGRWIRFVDADDLLPPESNAALLRASSAAFPVVYGQTRVCDEQLLPLRTMRCRRQGDVLIAGVIGKLDITLPAMMFERAVLASAGGFDPALELMEDHDLALRATAHVRVRSVDEIVYLYREHSGSASRQASLERSIECWTYVRDRFFERHPELEHRVRPRVNALIQLQKARAFAGRGELKAALRTIVRAVPAAPATAAMTGASILRELLRRSRSPHVD